MTNEQVFFISCKRDEKQNCEACTQQKACELIIKSAIGNSVISSRGTINGNF